MVDQVHNVLLTLSRVRQILVVIIPRQIHLVSEGEALDVARHLHYAILLKRLDRCHCVEMTTYCELLSNLVVEVEVELRPATLLHVHSIELLRQSLGVLVICLDYTDDV